MAEKVLQGISEQVFQRWQGICRVALIHRLGVVPVGQSSVIVVVSSPHRKDSLDAVHFAIDQIKALVPIWKKEIYGASESHSGGGQDLPLERENAIEPQWKTNKEWNAAQAADFSATSM